MDVTSKVKMAVSLATISRGAGAVNGTTVDAAGYDEILVLLDAGTNQATGTADVKIQHSVDDSTWNDLASAVFTQVTTVNDEGIFIGRLSRGLGNYAKRRYFRAVLTVATAACVTGVVFILMEKQPVQNTLETTPQWTV